MEFQSPARFLVQLVNSDNLLRLQTTLSQVNLDFFLCERSYIYAEQGPQHHLVQPPFRPEPKNQPRQGIFQIGQQSFQDQPSVAQNLQQKH